MLLTVPKGSTLAQSIIITVTINVTSLQQNPSASLTQLNSFHTTHPSRQRRPRTKSRWFSKISSTSSGTQVHQHHSQTMVLNCINVSEASTNTWPLHPTNPTPTRRHRYPYQHHVSYDPPLSNDKGCPPHWFKGWPPHQQTLLFSQMVQSSENGLQTDSSVRAKLSLLTPSISITTSNTVTATARNLINGNSAAI